jgi:DNA replication and repair protein RecF
LEFALCPIIRKIGVFCHNRLTDRIHRIGAVVMTLSRLDLSDFRNHAELTLRPEGGFIILHGPNGAGKTNILEAVSLLVPGRGLRRSAFSEMANRHGSGGFAISADLDGSRLGTAVQPETPGRRQVQINGAKATINDLAEWLAILWLTPAMDRLFTDGASGRRRFLDRLVLALEPGHALASSRYENALRQRNRMLSEGQGDAGWFDAIEASMAEYGAAIAAARRRTIEQLAVQLLHMPNLPFARPSMVLEQNGLEEAASLQKLWQSERGRDRAAGRTLQGPHRADLIVSHAANSMPASSCSTGEQKALLLSLILAHAHLVKQLRGAPPLLLLDEVAAHLDPARRADLFALLSETGGQVWMTGTEAALFEAAPASAMRLRIAEGGVEY